MLTVFWCTTSSTVLKVLWKMEVEPTNGHPCWWPCACLKCVSGLRKLEKNLDSLRCIHVIDLELKYGSDINERNWLQLLFYFIVLNSVIASVIGMSFFSAVFQVLERRFLVLHFDGNVCNWIPGVIWPRMGWFLGFLLGNGFLRWLHICTDWNLHELLSYFMFLTTSNSFDV